MYLLYTKLVITGHWKKITCHDKSFLIQETLKISKARENTIINS